MKLSTTSGMGYLKPAEAKKDEVITFKNEGEFEISEKYFYDEEKTQPKKSLVFVVDYQGQELKLRVNKASKINCIEAWGDDTTFWVHKKAKLIIMPTPNGNNKMIILDPVGGHVADENVMTQDDVEKSWEEAEKKLKGA